MFSINYNGSQIILVVQDTIGGGNMAWEREMEAADYALLKVIEVAKKYNCTVEKMDFEKRILHLEGDVLDQFQVLIEIQEWAIENFLKGGEEL